MDRRLLFPAVAITAWAQQPAPAPAPANAEAALRARAEQFYQLEVGKKFREAEAFVAEDTKDYFFNNGKPNIKAFKIDGIEFTDETHAIVHLSATVLMIAPGVPPQQFVSPAAAKWKLENGQWVWWVDQNAEIDTPFGKWRPGTGDSTGSVPPVIAAAITNPSDLTSLVTVDRPTVDLSGGNSKATIFNHMPGPISIALSTHPKGLAVAIDKTNLGANEKAVLSFTAAGDTDTAGTVHIIVSPLGQDITIQVK